MSEKLSNLNKTLKYKILKFDIPDCPIKYLQAGPNWIKFAFKKNDKITFGLRFSDFISEAIEYPRMQAKLEANAGSGRISLSIPDSENKEYVLKIASDLRSAADSIQDMPEQMIKYTIADAYGFSQLIQTINSPTYPEGVTGVEGNAYTFGKYDPITESVQWYPAIQPVGYFAKPVKKSKTATSYDDFDFPLIDFIDDIEKMPEEQ